MLKPYYQTELGILYHGDCQRVLREIPERSFSVVFADPPWDFKSIEWFALARQKSKKEARFFVCSSDKYLANLISAHLDIFRFFFVVPYAPSRVISSHTVLLNHMLIAFLCQGKTYFQNLKDGFTTLFPPVLKHRGFTWHKQEKPEWVIFKILAHYARRGDIVLDPFMGTGTTAAVCEKLGLQWIGIEIDLKMCEIIKMRLSKQVHFLFNPMREG